MSGKVLVVTNDFPPRRGGIESFVTTLCAGLPPSDLVVYTARMTGSDRVDRRLPYPVVRDRTGMLLPTPRVARAVRRVFADHGCDRVLFGASAPLGLLAGRLRAAGAERIVAISHGHEVWWSRVPVARSMLRRIGRQVDVLTFVSEYCRREISRALRPEDAAAMIRLSPGVDTDIFRPGPRVDAPTVVAASRLVARKGHDALLKAWERVLHSHPDATLLIVGSGPHHDRLARLAARPEYFGTVRLLPAEPWEAMPAVYAAGQVFALPCRTRLFGLEPEALGIVFLEAAACGLPVVVGRSGGAPETVIDGETGYVVDPRSPDEIATRIISLLDDPGAASAMGARGRERIQRAYSPGASAALLRQLLGLRDC